MAVDLWMPYYIHARFENFDLDTRSEWVGKAKYQRWMLSAVKQATSIKLATRGHFLRDLDFAKFHMAWPACFLCAMFSCPPLCYRWECTKCTRGRDTSKGVYRISCYFLRIRNSDRTLGCICKPYFRRSHSQLLFFFPFAGCYTWRAAL